MEKKATLNSNITLEETAQLIAAIGRHTTVLVQGEMGLGKSAILNNLSNATYFPQFKDYYSHYMDMTTKDIGDLTMPKARTENGVDIYSFIPNEEFGLHLKDKPAIIMMDEYGKARGAVLNACNRFIYERCVGIHKLHPESIVFVTTNLSIEGLGDTVPPHVKNRLTIVQVAKPTAEEWINNYAIPNDVDPVIISTVSEYPQMFASFTDYERPEQNPYIFDNRVSRTAFVTGRSMKRASDILKSCKHLDRSVLTHALIGTVGEAAANDIVTILHMESKLPTWEEIINSPDLIPVPSSAAQVVLLVMRAVQRIERDTVGAWMKYCNRLSKEAQALFAKNALSPKNPKQAVVAQNKEFADWCVGAHYLVRG